MDYIDSIENMRKCNDVFLDYMYKTFNVNIVNAFPQVNPRRLLVDTIQYVKTRQEYSQLSIPKINNIVLNKMRDYYVQHHGLIHSKRPQQRLLDRETTLYGQRPIAPDIPLPLNTSMTSKNETEAMYDKMVHSRKNDNSGIPQLPIPTISENKIDTEDFQRKLDELQKQRELNAIIPGSDENQYYRENRLLHQNHLQQQPHDPQSFYNSLNMKNDIQQKQMMPKQLDVAYTMSENPVDNIVTKSNYTDMHKKTIPLYSTPALKSLQDEPHKTIISPYNYIVINGYDRDWIRQKMRFQFSVEMSLLTKTYKNIHELALTKLIIPNEIINERTVSNPNPKVKFNHDYRMSVPYLTVQIDEISDVCDGINQVNQKAFTHFIQDNHYMTENGRGYTILIPMQNERKIFYPTPLASLPKMTITITRPNGTLFNNSRDKYHLWKVEYEEYNRKYIKIVLDNYFDKNEFHRGDIIYVKKFMLPKFDKEAEDLEDDPAYQVYLTNTYTYNKIMEFINREEGHEIIEIGKPNDDGFYRTFFVTAPGEFDAENGRFVIDKPMVDLIQSYNQENLPQILNPIKAGFIINSSLQPVLSMQINNSKGDAQELIQPKLI